MTPHKTPTVARYRLSLVKESEEPYTQLARCGYPERAAEFLHEIFEDAWQERMGALLLDTRNAAIGYTIAYTGGLARATAEPRGLLVPALLSNAAGIIAFHNHPSGDPTPSHEDLAFTRRLAEASEVVGVRFLDHIILGEKPAYVSLKRRGGW